MLSRQKKIRERQKFRERQKEKVADYPTTMLCNVLTVRKLLPVCFKRLQGQLLRLTTLRCRDEAFYYIMNFTSVY